MTVVILIILSSAICISNSTNAEKENSSFVTRWTKEYDGPIENLYYNNSGDLVHHNAGYADGDGNYYLKGYGVEANETLLISPGVKLHFESGSGITVSGSIQAIGTISEPILFTSNKSDPRVGAWKGIVVKPGSSATLKHCRIEYGFEIDVSSGNLTLEDCELFETWGVHVTEFHSSSITTIIRNTKLLELKNSENVGVKGLSILGGKKAIVTNSEFYSSYYYVQIISDEVEYTGNTAVNTLGVRISSKGEDITLVSNNKIKDTYLMISGNCQIEDNNFDNPNGTALELYLGDNEFIISNNYIIGKIDYYLEFQNHTIDARYNYWGTTDRQEIYEKLHPEAESILDIDYDWVDIIFEPYLDKNGNEYTGEDDPAIWIFKDKTQMTIVIAVIIGVLVILILLIELVAKRRSARTKQTTGNSSDDKVVVTVVEVKKEKVEIECPGCSHSFKIKSGQKEIKCPECGLEGEI